MRNLKILIIDDQLSHLRIVKKMVERFGWQACTADSAEVAELMLEYGHEFCAIITDLKMPWMTGLEFCQIVKKKYPQIKIYALSGNLDLFDYDELKKAGFDGFYFKPITLDTVENLLAAISSGASEN
jgi:two-component system response regulator YesN